MLKVDGSYRLLGSHMPAVAGCHRLTDCKNSEWSVQDSEATEDQLGYLYPGGTFKM